MRAKLARLRAMESPNGLFEPPPEVTSAAEQPAPSKRADLGAKLAEARTKEPRTAHYGLQPSAALETQPSARNERSDLLRARLARLRAMEPPAALFEPPPLVTLETELFAPSERTDLRTKLAQQQAAKLPVALFEPPPTDAIEAARPAHELTDVRAKLARLRSMEPPAALFEPPSLPQPEAAIDVESPASSERLGLRAKLARLRSMEPPAALFEPPPLAAESAASPAPTAFSLHKGERIAQLRSLIAEVAARESRRAPVSAQPSEAKPPPWAQESTDNGPLHVCARYLEPGHQHGHAPVRSALSALPATLPSLVCDADYADIDLRRALYLDTETTGLAGGTGTVAFLVGLARFEDESLCLEQLVVPQLGTETPMLVRLAERIAAASCIVTYNGKSFDWPLLRTRFVLARLPIPALPPHVDLLHVCRRLWKKRLATVRLVDMEREVLRFEREDDLPGSEIPTRYFEFLRGGS
ncbi:MAG TPA: ribonuclease H-like domain-containing protein, partial [Polyangiales bacterium]|nr:ribonuclease H-like domain-containing protein [Polyangiales bacterium]